MTTAERFPDAQLFAVAGCMPAAVVYRRGRKSACPPCRRKRHRQAGWNPQPASYKAVAICAFCGKGIRRA